MNWKRNSKNIKHFNFMYCYCFLQPFSQFYWETIMKDKDKGISTLKSKIIITDTCFVNAWRSMRNHRFHEGVNGLKYLGTPCLKWLIKTIKIKAHVSLFKVFLFKYLFTKNVCMHLCMYVHVCVFLSFCFFQWPW